MLDRMLFALGFGLGLPSFMLAVGAELPDGRLAAWGLFGFILGWVVPTALDWSFQWTRAEEISQRRQRDALTAATEVATAERWARLQVPAAVETPPDTSHAWYSAIETFILAGDVRGFSIRKMQGVAGSDVWEQLTTLLAEAGWLEKVPGRGYRWADGYNLAQAMQELRADRLPFPTGPAPVVNPPQNNATLRNAPQRAATVIQGN